MEFDESAYELMCNKDRVVSLGIPCTDEHRVIEFVGCGSSGKSELAMHASINVILPKSLGGDEGTVLWFDSDCTLNPQRWIQVLLAMVESKLPADINGNDIVDSCMKRLIVYRCLSSHQLLYSLNSLSEEYINNVNVKLIVVDNAASFYWVDLETDPISAGYHVSIPATIKMMAKRDPALVFILIKPVLFGNNKTSEYLSQTWQRLITLRLFVLSTNGHSHFRMESINDKSMISEFIIGPQGIEFK